MDKVFIYGLLLVFLLSCCDEKVRTIASFPIPDKSIYDGNFGQKIMTPEWLANRNYLVLSVLVQTNNELLVDSTKLRIDELSTIIDTYWSRIAKDDYQTVLNTQLKNERNVDYEFYQTVYQLIKNSYIAEKNKISQKKFQKNIDELSKKELKEISWMIPVLLNEGEPTGFD